MARDPRGDPQGFLGSEENYRFVRKLQQQNRIVPVVGDFAGRHALASVGREMARRGLTLNTFYVSNVEQYLLGDGATWKRWRENLSRLTGDSESLIVRAYLDQGERHPRQRPGQRTTTVVQRWSFVVQQQRSKSQRSLLQLSSEQLLGDGETVRPVARP